MSVTLSATLTPPITGSTVLLQRNLVAPNIEVVFPKPCATLPLDRTGNNWTTLGPAIYRDTGNLPIDFSFTFFGSAFTSVRVFNTGYIYFPDGDPSYAYVFGWQTVIDTSGNASGLVWYKAIGSNTFAVAWDRVGVFNKNDSGPNTFQIMFSDGTNPDMGIGNNLCLCYLDMGSVRVRGEAIVGATTSGGSFRLGTFDHPGTDYDGPGDTSAGWDYLDNKSFCYKE